MQPEQFYQWLKLHIKREWVLCFCSVMAFGLLAHIYKLMNFLPNWDSILNLYTDQDKVELGRCFLKYTAGISSYYDLPWINGLLSLIYIAFSGVCLTELFGLKKVVSIGCLGGLLVTFPTVTSTLAYNYTADGYFLALLLMSGAVLLADRKPKLVLVAGLMMALGLGSYQAYITFAMVLILFYLIDQVLYEEITLVDLWHKGVTFCVSGISGAVFYYTAEQILVRMKGIEISEYQGIGDAFSLLNLHPGLSLRNMKNHFIHYFFDFSRGIRLGLVLNVAMFVLLLLMMGLTVKENHILQEKWKMICLLFFIVSTPIASFALYFLHGSLDYHNLMLMSLCLYYIQLPVFYERMNYEQRNLKKNIRKQWCILILSALLIYNNTLVANISYQKMHIAYEKSYGILVRVTDRIEQMEGASSCRKLAVLGHLPGSEEYSVAMPPDMTGITDSYIIRDQDPIMHENVFLNMLQDYSGLTYEDTSKEEIDAILDGDTYANMQNWPDQSSIAVIGDTLVIKFGDVENE